MVKRSRPCPYCGEYGTGSPGEGCCGQTTSNSYSKNESSGLPEIILGGALLFTILGASIGRMATNKLEKQVCERAAQVGAGIGFGLYATGVGTAIYFSEKKRRENEREKQNRKQD
ncbi:hypothetical protein GF378_02285 [Candidatus Pacearchaeota archaeon]|nr:hypothetical protein [Candidatus Pacearchaeota archaeon]